MSGNWVGFQSMPKAQAGLTTRHLRLNLETPAQHSEVLELLTTSSGLSKWLGATSKCQASVGAKFRTQMDGVEVENVFIAISLPRQVVLMNEALGEINAKIKNSADHLQVSITISRATTDVDFESWHLQASAVTAKLEALIARA